MFKLSATFYSAIFFIVIGILFFSMSLSFEFGTASNMGPAYFPRVLSVILVFIGILNLIKSFLVKSKDSVEYFSIRPAIFVIAASISFGFLINVVGLLASTAILVVLASNAIRIENKKQILFLSLLLSAFAGVVFYGVLNMPFKLLAWGF